MSALAWISITVGALIIVTRAPLIVFPRGTLNFYQRLWATNARVRILGLFIAVLCAALIRVAGDAGETAGPILLMLGWLLLVAVGLVMVALPRIFRRLAESVMQTAERSVEPAALRAVGVVASAVGAALVVVGLTWL